MSYDEIQKQIFRIERTLEFCTLPLDNKYSANEKLGYCKSALESILDDLQTYLFETSEPVEKGGSYE